MYACLDEMREEVDVRLLPSSLRFFQPCPGRIAIKRASSLLAMMFLLLLLLQLCAVACGILCSIHFVDLDVGGLDCCWLVVSSDEAFDLYVRTCNSTRRCNFAFFEHSELRTRKNSPALQTEYVRRVAGYYKKSRQIVYRQQGQVTYLVDKFFGEIILDASNHLITSHLYSRNPSYNSLTEPSDFLLASKTFVT